MKKESSCLIYLNNLTNADQRLHECLIDIDNLEKKSATIADNERTVTCFGLFRLKRNNHVKKETLIELINVAKESDSETDLQKLKKSYSAILKQNPVLNEIVDTYYQLACKGIFKACDPMVYCGR